MPELWEHHKSKGAYQRHHIIIRFDWQVGVLFSWSLGGASGTIFHILTMTHTRLRKAARTYSPLRPKNKEVVILGSVVFSKRATDCPDLPTFCFRGPNWMKQKGCKPRCWRKNRQNTQGTYFLSSFYQCHVSILHVHKTKANSLQNSVRTKFLTSVLEPEKKQCHVKFPPGTCKGDVRLSSIQKRYFVLAECAICTKQ